METFNFEDTYELADTLETMIMNDVHPVVVAPADIMSCLVCDLISTTVCTFGTIDLNTEYDDIDHILEFSGDLDDEIKIWVTPAISPYSKKPMMFDDCDVLLIHEDSNSTIMTANKKQYHECKTFTIGCEDDYEFDDEEVAEVVNVEVPTGIIVTHNAENGISQSWSDGDGTYFSRSFYSTNPKIMETVLTDWKQFAETF